MEKGYKKVFIFSISIVGIIVLAIVYGYLNMKYNIGIPCAVNKMFGIYCPGCGLTRAGIAIMNFDFYQAFRYNALSILFIPLLFLLIVLSVWEYIFDKRSFIFKIPIWVWVILCGVAFIYGIIRNFIPELQPVTLLQFRLH